MSDALKNFTELDLKKHGVGGLVKGRLRERKQDRRAKPLEMYAVAWFPKYTRLGPARLTHWQAIPSMAHTPELAIAKFLDGTPNKWDSLYEAGWRVRRVKLSDIGDP